MKKLPLYLAIFAAIFALGGCENTGEGIAKDTEENAQDVSKATNNAIDAAGEAAENVGENVSAAAQNAGAATMLTPRLKTAITADKELNEDGNLVNIDSTDEMVTIDGHVKTDALRKRAEDIVRKEMDQAGAKQKLVNNLKVQP